ncbi:MAG TPA: hypothetical protein VK923_20855 [Euzebyales bacterium]|nr:hypothetical protein [Euzebyales bacterium]
MSSPERDHPTGPIGDMHGLTGEHWTGGRWPEPPPGTAPPLAPADGSNGMAGMVLGIIALAIVWVPFLGILALPLAMIGAPLAGVGFFRAKRGGLGLGVPIAGIATNVVAVIGWFGFAVAYIGAVPSTPV